MTLCHILPERRDKYGRTKSLIVVSSQNTISEELIASQFNHKAGELDMSWELVISGYPKFGFIVCREEENLVFWFGAQFISTLNFNQSGWLILFSPDLHFRPPKLVSCQTQSLWLGNADQNRRSSGRSYLAMLFS